MKTITTPHGKVLVDESAEIKEGDWFVGINNIIWQRTLINPTKPCNKIIATINHSVSLDIPMVIVEDEIEKLALKENPKKTTAGYYDHWSTPKRKGFKAGFERAQQKGVYSEAQLRKAMDMAQELSDNPNLLKYTPDEIIKSLNQDMKK